MIQITIRVRKQLLYCYLQPENRLLIIGLVRAKPFTRGMNIMFSVVPRVKRKEPSYIGKARYLRCVFVCGCVSLC